MDRFLDLIAEVELSDDDIEIATTDIKTVQAQAKSPRPNGNIITESLKSLRTIFEGAIGGLGARNREIPGLIDHFVCNSDRQAGRERATTITRT